MSRLSWSKLPIENRTLIATVSIVVLPLFVAYIGWLQDSNAPSVSKRWLALGLALVYLAALLAAPSFFNRLGKPLPLILLWLLGFTIQYLLSQNFTIWIITMPLVGMAMEHLTGWRRWFYCLAILCIIPLSHILNGGSWVDSLLLPLYFLPALIFVIIFVQLVLSADEQRHKAEQLATDLEAANHQLAAYAAQAEELATTKERNRIAREIHDTLGHYLTVVNMQIKAAQAVMAQQPEKAQDVLQKAQKLTEEGLTAVRQSVSALRDSPLGQKSLSVALADLLAETENSGIVTQFDIAGQPRPLDAKLDLTLYRAVQEGLTNIRKHARASRVDLLLDYRAADQVQLQIKDNGVGTAVSPTNGFGLLGLRERVHLLGGRLETETTPGNGFKLVITLPG
ncbi:MAG: sensor histidine kinase [Ardenticatenaceae bacterium]|nr:sensor histidine kinase [Ardenticatenaceae bacterium]